MSLYQHQLEILSILSENLKTPHPRLVPTATIAGKLDLEPTELRQVLKTMNGTGVIQTDEDLQYTLITQKGLTHLGEHHLYISNRL